MAPRVALVTGSNKGIGFGIVRALCKQFNGDVYLTARDEGRGAAAMEALKKEGLSPKFHQLDIDDQTSLDRAKTFFQEKYNGLDVLVNNAGIAFKHAATEPISEQAEVTLRTNFWGTLHCCETLFPLLKPHARVSNVSSVSGVQALQSCSTELKQKFIAPMTLKELKTMMQQFVEVVNLSSLYWKLYFSHTNPDLKEKFYKPMNMQDLENLMEEFVQATRAGNHQQKGWPNSTYGVSKMGVAVMTRIQQRDMENDPREDIVINACCPGYVDTDMSSHKGPKTIDEGAETPVYLALLPPNITSPKGEFVEDKKIIPWK